MPTLLSPSSSQEIVLLSSPIASSSSQRARTSTTLPAALPFDPSADLKPMIHAALKVQRAKEEGQRGKRKAKSGEVEKERKRVREMDRSRVTEHMMTTMGKGVNPITNSDLYSRTDHFVSAATGHQQSNRGRGSGGAATYWEVRTAKMAEQARSSRTELLKGCVFYINGSTGPRVSNLQLQNMITSNGGRFTPAGPTQNSSCTHIVANGGLSGSKTQKWIDGQGGRGASRRAKVVRVEWVLDSVERGTKLSEAGYGVIEDPSQVTLFKALGVKPKLESEVKAEAGEGSTSKGQ